MKILKSYRPSDKEQKFYTFDGDCYKIEDKPFGTLPVRRDCSKHYREIDSINKLKSSLRAGEYTFPVYLHRLFDVGYRLFFYTDDGSVLSFDSVLENLQEIFYSMRNDMKDGWSIVGMGSVEEIDEDVYCDHSGDLLK